MAAQEIDWPAGDVCLRRLVDDDIALIETHLLSLDMLSRNSRFRSGFGDAAITAYVHGLDVTRDILFGGIELETHRIVALAEARPADTPRTVELGTSVLTEHRRRGLAKRLAACAVDTAFREGMTAVQLFFSPADPAASRIAARLGARFPAPGFGVVRARPEVRS